MTGEWAREEHKVRGYLDWESIIGKNVRLAGWPMISRRVPDPGQCFWSCRYADAGVKGSTAKANFLWYVLGERNLSSVIIV